MKRCPECRRDYYDDTLLYCLEDGVALVQGPVSVDAAESAESATAILHETAAPSEAPTNAQIHTTEQTAVLPSGVRDVSRSGGLGKRLILLPVVLAMFVFGGFVVYRYLAPSKQIESLAVMPFVNESGNNEYEYLSDGLTETLINSLSQMPNLSVKARSSVFSYKGKNATTQQIGTELAVQAVLNGRVLQRGDNVTLSVELVDTRNGNQIWGEQYNRKMVDLTALQSSIARDVSNELHQKLTAGEGSQIAKKHTADSEAYQLYLKGLFHWNKRTVDDLNKAIVYFDKAQERDQSFALAYVGLAVTYSVLPSNTLLTKDETIQANLKAIAAAHRARELDSSLAEPHAVLGMAKLVEWDFLAAQDEFKRALQLNPNYATGRQWYSELLGRLGRIDEALLEVKKAYELDPFSTAVNMNLGLRYAEAGRLDDAVAQFKRTIELGPDYAMAHWYLADIYLERGMFEESLAMGLRGDLLLKIETPESGALKTSEVRQALRTGGVKLYWRKMLEYEIEFYNEGISSPFHVASIYAELGEKDKAFEWLEEAYRNHSFELTQLKNNRRFRSIRSDSRFRDLLGRVGLPQ